MNLKKLPIILYKNRWLLILVLFTLVFCWRVTVVQKELAYLNEQIMVSIDRQTVLLQQFQEMRPYRIRGHKEPDFTARSVASVLIDKEGKETILFEKDIDLVLPIASISKLMTAYVSLNHHEPSNRITELIHFIIIHSNNWAAEELAQVMGRAEFVTLMNTTAQDLGLENTYFVNPTGLDQGDFNRSTSREMIDFARHVLEKEPIIWRISSLEEYRGSANTNILLGQTPGIIGGKTGGTVKAAECLIVLTEAPEDKGYIISVVLGSADRFAEMENLLNWVEESYLW